MPHTNRPRTRTEILEEVARTQAAICALQVQQSRLLGELAAEDEESRVITMLRADPAPLFLNIKDAARMARVTPETVKYWCRSEGFGARPILENGGRGHWKVERDPFIEFLKARADRKPPTPRFSEVS